MSCVCNAFVSVHCCLMVICWERVDSRLSCVMFNCVFCYLPMWHPLTGVVFGVSIPDLYHLSYLKCCLYFGSGFQFYVLLSPFFFISSPFYILIFRMF